VTRAKAEEYRRRAQEYLELARKISLERDRAVLLDMAQSCRRLAEEQEAQEEITPPPTVEQPQPAAQQHNNNNRSSPRTTTRRNGAESGRSVR
jgi:truncated hemoglobin YjbI